METLSRSFLKTLSWRILATLTTAIIVYAFTGKLELAFAVGGIEAAAKMALYFFHERAWARVSYGKRLHPQAPQKDQGSTAPMKEQYGNA